MSSPDIIEFSCFQKALSSASSSEVGSPPQYGAKFDPPSYNDCINSTPGLSPCKTKSSPSHSSKASKNASANVLAPMGSPSHLPPENDLVGADIEGATGYTPNRKEQTSEKALLKKALGLDEEFTPSPAQMPPMMSLLNHDYTGKIYNITIFCHPNFSLLYLFPSMC